MTALEKWKNDFKGFISELSMPKDDYNGIIEYIDEVPLEQQPCDNCISREDALMALTGDITDCTIEEFIAKVRERLSKLPSVGKDINVTTNKDCISRENLLKAFKDECRGECDNCPYFRKVDKEYKCRLIADFPSVMPKETETWNDIHTQITAPKDIFEQIFNDADDNDI